MSSWCWKKETLPTTAFIDIIYIITTESANLPKKHYILVLLWFRRLNCCLNCVALFLYRRATRVTFHSYQAIDSLFQNSTAITRSVFSVAFGGPVHNTVLVMYIDSFCWWNDALSSVLFAFRADLIKIDIFPVVPIPCRCFYFEVLQIDL